MVELDLQIDHWFKNITVNLLIIILLYVGIKEAAA